MKKLEKMEEVKKPASGQTKQKEPKLSPPLFLLLCHVSCVALFLLCMLADWARGDMQSQNITSVAVFLLPVLLVAAIIFWTNILPSGVRLSSPAFMVCCFFVIGIVWTMVFERFSGMHRPVTVSPDAAADIIRKEYINNIKFSLYIFGLMYTAADSVILFLYFLLRWIISLIRNARTKNSAKAAKKK